MIAHSNQIMLPEGVVFEEQIGKYVVRYYIYAEKVNGKYVVYKYGSHLDAPVPLFECDQIVRINRTCTLVRQGSNWYVYDHKRLYEEYPFQKYKRMYNSFSSLAIHDGTGWRLVATEGHIPIISTHQFAYVRDLIRQEDQGQENNSYLYAWFLVSDKSVPEKFGVYFGEWLLSPVIEREIPIIYDQVSVDFENWQLVCFTKDFRIVDVYDMSSGVIVNSFRQ